MKYEMLAPSEAVWNQATANRLSKMDSFHAAFGVTKDWKDLNVKVAQEAARKEYLAAVTAETEAIDDHIVKIDEWVATVDDVQDKNAQIRGYSDFLVAMRKSAVEAKHSLSLHHKAFPS